MLPVPAVATRRMGKRQRGSHEDGLRWARLLRVARGRRIGVPLDPDDRDLVAQLLRCVREEVAVAVEDPGEELLGARAQGSRSQ